MITLSCQVCGKEFEVKPSTAKRGRKYCSRECYQVAYAEHPNCSKNETSICQNCGKEFSIKPSILKRGRGKYCSKKCYAEAKKVAVQGQQNPNWKNARVQRTCIQCGATFEVYECHLNTGARVFCSRACMAKHKERSTLGENNPNWKGGPVRYPVGWRNALRKRIRDYAGRQCELCGKTEQENGARLSIHHIDYDKDNLEEENLVALCRACHGLTNGQRDYWEYWFRMGLVPEMTEAGYVA